MNTEKIRMSAEEYKKLEEELEYLRSVNPAEIIQTMKQISSVVNPSGTDEYDEKKIPAISAVLESWILEKEMILANAVIVDES